MVLSIFCSDGSKQKIKLHHSFVKDHTGGRNLSQMMLLDKCKEVAISIVGPNNYKKLQLDIDRDEYIEETKSPPRFRRR